MLCVLLPREFYCEDPGKGGSIISPERSHSSRDEQNFLAPSQPQQEMHLDLWREDKARQGPGKAVLHPDLGGGEKRDQTTWNFLRSGTLGKQSHFRTKCIG